MRPACISQREIARRIGLSPQAVADRVAGRTRWQIADVFALADLLEVPVSDLLGLDQSEPEAVR